MFMLSNYVCWNNLHVQILHDSVINAKHNFAAVMAAITLMLVTFFTLLLISFRYHFCWTLKYRFLFQIQSLDCNFKQGILKAF